MAVAQDLLEILRCPYCVSGPTRKPGDDPGRLELVRGVWLVCQEPDCGRKYPIKEDIPVMLIEEGDQWVQTAVEDLPEPGRLVEPDYFNQFGEVSGSELTQPQFDRRLWLGLVGLLGLILAVGLLVWLRRQDSDQALNDYE